MALYTPFMEKVGAQLGASMQRTGRAELAGNAYMGGPGAMEELMRVDPNLGIRIQEQKRTSQQKKVQGDTAQIKKQQAQRKIYSENRKLMDGIFKNTANIEDHKQAQSYVQRKFEEYSNILGEHADAKGFTPEVHAQVKKVFGGGDLSDPVHQSIDIPGEGVKQIKKSGDVKFIPISVEGSQAFIRSQENKIKQATTKSGKIEAAKLAAKSREDLKRKVNDAAFSAREQLPRINNLEELAGTAISGSFGQQRMEFKRLFGIDVSTEEEFVAESNRVILAAADSLKGALSARENAYLEAVSPNIGKSSRGNLAIVRNLKTITENAIDRQKFLKKFTGDPVDFDFIGKPLKQVDITPVESKEGQIYINPKTGQKGKVVDGKWQNL